MYLTSLSNSAVLDGMGAILAYGKHKNKDQRYEFSTTFEASFNVMKNLNVRANYSYLHYNYQTMNRTVNVPYSKYPGEISYLTTGSGVNQLKETQTNHWYQAFNVMVIYAGYCRPSDKNHGRLQL